MNDKATRPGSGVIACLILALILLAGCASPTPAPIRDGTTVPPPGAAPEVAPPTGQTHVVRPGDTLMGIGRLYGQNIDDLVIWNSLMDPNQLRVGQAIRVSPPVAEAPEAVAIAQPVDIQPAVPNSDIVLAPVKHEPRGGRQPYSDQAWAAISPAALPPPAAIESPQPGPRDSVWLWPAPGPVIKAFDAVTNDGETPNKGIDISGNPGDPVIAAAGGKVVYAGSGLRGFGKLVIISHADDYLTAYAHNQALLVKEGDEVSRGQRIAELGSTDADRPKLHFEIRRQGRPLDPMQYLPAR